MRKVSARAKKLEDLGFKSEEIFTEVTHPDGKNRMDFRVKTNGNNKYIEVKASQESYLTSFEENQLKYSDYFVVLYTENDGYNIKRELIFTKKEFMPLLNRGKVSSGRRKKDGYWFYHYSEDEDNNKNLDEYKRKTKLRNVPRARAHGPTLVERTKQILRRAGVKLRRLIADSQYSSGRMRDLVDEAVIPFMSNQRRGENVLRVDRKFRTHGPEEERAEYHKRPAVEAAYAFLKTQYGMKVNKVRGLGRVAVYALYSVLCHVLTREAAENMGRPDKAVSPTFFNT